MANRKQPVLSAGDSISLRPWTRADAADVMEAFNEPSIEHWHMRRLDLEEEALAWIEAWHERWRAESDASWAITNADGKTLLGYVALRDVNLEFGYAEVTYWVLPAFRSRGIATRACVAVADWAFADLGLHRLEVRHSTANVASCRVALNAGFEPEGTSRSALLHLDGWHDMHVHSRISETQTMTNPKRIVEQGYDAIADRYTEWATTNDPDLRMQHVAKLFEVVPSGSEVLELGCGSGVPVAKALAERYKLTGVDISKAQLDRAHVNVPTARFIQSDMMAGPFPAEAFDAVVALFCITHVPRGEHADLLAQMRSWIKPGGYLLANMGSGDDPGTIEEDWLGTPMFFSGFDAATNTRLLQEAGFDIIEAEVITHKEDGQPVAFLWVLARAGVEDTNSAING